MNLDNASRHDEKELAYALLVLERQLNAYERLHKEDLVALRAALEDLKTHVLTLDGNPQGDLTGTQDDAGVSVSLPNS